MDVNNSKKIKSISSVDKTILKSAINSARRTRKKVRENIKNRTLPEIPKDIDRFLSA